MNRLEKERDLEKNWLITIFAFMAGSAVGSFLNVLIYRLPLGRSVIAPPSACPVCGSKIKPWHNIPILSYLLLRGKCAACGTTISARYPFVETLTGLAWAAMYLRSFGQPWFASHLIMITGLIPVTFIDLDHKIIPDRLSLGGIILGFALSFVNGLGWKASLIGLAAGGLSLWAVAEGYRLAAKREGMGFGDVKLLAAIGAFLGWKAVVMTVVVASITGAVTGLAAMKLTKGGRHMEIPFGPFLSFGAALYLYRGTEILAWYLGT